MKLENISNKEDAYKFLGERFNEIKKAVHNRENSIPDKVDEYLKIQISLKRKYHLNPQQDKLIKNYKKELGSNLKKFN